MIYLQDFYIKDNYCYLTDLFIEQLLLKNSFNFAFITTLNSLGKMQYVDILDTKLIKNYRGINITTNAEAFKFLIKYSARANKLINQEVLLLNQILNN